MQAGAEIHRLWGMSCGRRRTVIVARRYALVDATPTSVPGRKLGQLERAVKKSHLEAHECRLNRTKLRCGRTHRRGQHAQRQQKPCK
jgi:hypothetical protein